MTVKAHFMGDVSGEIEQMLDTKHSESILLLPKI